MPKNIKPKEPAKPKLAVFKFASCDGCQLSLLDAEDALYWPWPMPWRSPTFVEARDRRLPGPYDVSLVEGSISTEHQIEEIKEIRRQSNFLIAIGACATAGGIQSLRNWRDVDDYINIVYANPSYIDTLATSTPVSDHVKVDFELRGCPINKYQLLRGGDLPAGGTPTPGSHLQRLHGMQAPGHDLCDGGAGHPLLGASYPGRVRCHLSGCTTEGASAAFGPMEAPNTDALGQQLQAVGATPAG
jgi:sulfhydrogenase subunit delta